MVSDNKTLLTRHAQSRLCERTELTYFEIAELMDEKRYVALGYLPFTTVIACLVYSKPNEAFYVLVVNPYSRAVVTVLPFVADRPYCGKRVKPEQLERARRLALYGPDKPAEPEYDHRIRLPDAAHPPKLGKKKGRHTNQNKKDRGFSFEILVNMAAPNSPGQMKRKKSGTFKIRTWPEPLDSLTESSEFLQCLETFISQSQIDPDSLLQLFILYEGREVLLADFRKDPTPQP